MSHVHPRHSRRDTYKRLHDCNLNLRWVWCRCFVSRVIVFLVFFCVTRLVTGPGTITLALLGFSVPLATCWCVCVWERDQDTECLHVVFDDSSGFICIFLIFNRTREIGLRRLHFRILFVSVCETHAHHECTWTWFSPGHFTLWPDRHVPFWLVWCLKTYVLSVWWFFYWWCFQFEDEKWERSVVFVFSMNSLSLPSLRMDLSVKALRKWKMCSSFNV